MGYWNAHAADQGSCRPKKSVTKFRRRCGIDCAAAYIDLAIDNAGSECYEAVLGPSRNYLDFCETDTARIMRIDALITEGSLDLELKRSFSARRSCGEEFNL